MKYTLRQLFLFTTSFFTVSCATAKPTTPSNEKPTEVITPSKPQPTANIIVGADNYDVYLPMLMDKKVGVVTNPTSILNHVPSKARLVHGLANKAP